MHTCTYNLGDQRLSDTLELESEVAMSYQIRVLDGYQGLPQKLLRAELSHLPSLTETFSWSSAVKCFPGTQSLWHYKENKSLRI